MQGKTANIGDDIESKHIKMTAQLKKVVTGEVITVERKMQQPFAFEPTLKLIFTTNQLPTLSDSSQGMNDRIIVIPLTARIRGTKKADPHIIDKIIESGGLSYILNRAIKEYNHIARTFEFSIPQSILDATEEYQRDNNPILDFIEEAETVGISILEGNYTTCKRLEGTDSQTVYRMYEVWCKDNGYTVLDGRVFGKMLKHAGYERVQHWNGEMRGKRTYQKKASIEQPTSNHKE